MDHEPGKGSNRALPLVDIGPMCRRLRSKQMYMQIEPDPDLPPTDDGFVWCTHTMNCLGPDGKVADRETCLAGRGCFETT
jgi:hypothetical protein